MRILTGKEREDAMLATLCAAAENPTRERWGDAWMKRHEAYLATKNIDELRPRYLDRGYHREGGEYVVHGNDESYHWDKRCRMLDAAAEHLHAAGAQVVVELGCGTGWNLVYLAELLGESVQLYGTDWDETIRKRATELPGKITGVYMDMRTPRMWTPPRPPVKWAAITVGSIELLGKDWGPLLEWFIRFQPCVVFHSEPIYELYDQTNLFDYVAAKYHERRGYAIGYYPQLKKLEDEGFVEIMEQSRAPGSCHHDGSTVIVWRPV